MKKIFVALSMVAFLAACSGEGGNSTNPSDDEPTTLNSAEGQGGLSSTKKSTDSSDSRCEECNDDAISSSGNAESNGSSSSKQNAESSDSAKQPKSNGSSADEVESSSSNVVLSSSEESSPTSSSFVFATPCKTEAEDNCEYGTLLDDRDGQTYKTVKIGGQWWMAENLNYQTENSWCGGGNHGTAIEGDCSVYGRLYTWAAAVGKSEDECGYGYECDLGSDNIQGVCPDGWHVPYWSEWNTLIFAVGGDSMAGQKLKAATGWDKSSGVSNEDAHGFSALPAGARARGESGVFGAVGISAFFWSASQFDEDWAYNFFLGYDKDRAYLYNDNKSNGISVRCVKD